MLLRGPGILTNNVAYFHHTGNMGSIGNIIHQSSELNNEPTAENIAELIANDTLVQVAGVDGDGQFRGKIISKEKFLSIAESGFGMSSALFGWDMHDLTYFRELKISNAENGYRDIIAEVDLSSYRRLPWENGVPFFLVSFREPDGESLSACPRSLLERQAAKIEKKGMGAMAGGS